MPHAKTVKREDRPDVPQRAGTRLTPGHKQPIRGTNLTSKHPHGYVDVVQRVYQSGGEFSNFYNWSRHEITMDGDAWDAVALIVDRIEFIDHTANEAYLIPMVRAIRYARPYGSAMSRRVGIPLSAFDRYDADGTLIRRSPIGQVNNEVPHVFA